MKKTIALLVLLTAVSTATYAQQDRTPSRAQERYEEFRRKTRERYESFMKEVNDRYADLMERVWERYNANKPVDRPRFDEPPVPVVDTVPAKPIEPRPVPIKDVVDVPKPSPVQPKPLEPVPVQPVKPETPRVTFDYLGSSQKVTKPELPRLASRNEGDVARAWKAIGSSQANTAMLSDLLKLRDQLNLCDWAYMLLIDNALAAVDGTPDSRTLMHAWLLASSGYSMRLGNDSSNLVLLFGTDHVIYDRSYYSLNGHKFYPYKNSASNMAIFQQEYPGEKMMSLSVPKLPKLGVGEVCSNDRTSRAYPSMKLHGCVDLGHIAFFDAYPPSHYGSNFMTRWATIAWTPFSDVMKGSLIKDMKAALAGKSERDGVAMILNWVQTGFEYKVDDAVWGHDRAFFAEETIYYPFNDCEDRAILFSKLVREIYGLKTALVYYPGHLAAAVHFNVGPYGDYIQVDGEDYTICDPTFINAPIGRTMTGMDNSKATLIKLD